MELVKIRRLYVWFVNVVGESSLEISWWWSRSGLFVMVKWAHRFYESASTIQLLLAIKYEDGILVDLHCNQHADNSSKISFVPIRSSVTSMRNVVAIPALSHITARQPLTRPSPCNAWSGLPETRAFRNLGSPRPENDEIWRNERSGPSSSHRTFQICVYVTNIESRRIAIDLRQRATLAQSCILTFGVSYHEWTTEFGVIIRMKNE